MSKNDTEKAYVLVKDSNDNEYLCPITAGRKPATGKPDEVDDCVEAEVVGRYAGNLN